MTSKKEQILQAVIELIKKEGLLSNFKVSDIAKKADVGKGTIYEYFKSKDEMISETICYILEKNNARIEKAINEDLSFEESLLSHIKIVSNVMIENYQFNMLLFSQDIKCTINHEYKQKIVKKVFELKHDYHFLLKNIINKGVKEGKFKEVEDDFTIISISNLIVTSIVFYFHSNNQDNESFEDLIYKIYNLILKILA